MGRGKEKKNTSNSGGSVTSATTATLKPKSTAHDITGFVKTLSITVAVLFISILTAFALKNGAFKSFGFGSDSSTTSLSTATTSSSSIVSDEGIACNGAVDINGLCTSSIPKGANAEGKPREADGTCVDRHEECKAFFKQGECIKNPGWMIINCPASCRACELRDPKKRCDRKALNITLEPVYQPGDMNTMFSTLQSKYGNRYDINVISTDPWIVTFDNFLTNIEIDALIKTQTKWERSTDTGLTNEFGETGRILSQGRTSSNSWCMNECSSHPDVKKIVRKIEEITMVPSINYESFQVLKYNLGQKYVKHHDYGIEEVQLACGPRILTFFLYLSDVEEGGETAFPDLNIAIKPKKGRALLWPSTLDSDIEKQDIRTMHEAKPVIKGIKYAANSWIHLYNFEVPNLWGCTGTFDEL